MGHLSDMFNGLTKSMSIKKMKRLGNSGGREAVEAMAEEAKRNELMLKSSGTVSVDGSNNFTSVFSKRGKKGVNQDCSIVWEQYGRQEDMLFCGIFDGHGPWGHFVSKLVRDSLPLSLLCNWQDALVETAVDLNLDIETEKTLQRFSLWEQSYLKACAFVDQQLGQHRKIDSFYSGTTSLTVVRQGNLIVVANVGDSRAVLATTSDDGSTTAIQLTTDFKPNLPHEAERILQCKGRIFCLDDEPGFHRVWLPCEESPGLAMSRAFGDFCIKDFGVISVPEVTKRQITNRDQFIVLATDGVWDVISNEEAVAIVSSTPDRAKAAKRLVDSAASAWKHKRRGIAMDDISAICLFFHNSQLPHQIHPVTVPK
ncbi:hypothetical protein DCAR_0103579 [Daucus carota subsp. sativus]|uniref:protein-serine/threonine phosphatase n=1 Tax=Daucus carota subsp. sativus TaxID=79200 RepID=A0A166I3X3_DAUCS|nr:PREDICTED: probable protein phosphatase 2C 34 [Daucus carota subsp. sativus]WOG84396.1 hypothetical protein DCAR_0103579 [Daucus carota subsp. sativus]